MTICFVCLLSMTEPDYMIEVKDNETIAETHRRKKHRNPYINHNLCCVGGNGYDFGR